MGPYGTNVLLSALSLSLSLSLSEICFLLETFFCFLFLFLAPSNEIGPIEDKHEVVCQKILSQKTLLYKECANLFTF